MKVKTVYACTHIEKTAQADDCEHGVSGKLTCVMSEHVANLTERALPDLINAIGDRFGLDLDDLFIPHDDKKGGVTSIGFNQLETVDGDVPDEEEMRDWKRGEITLYLADYDFMIEKRTVSPVPLDEFASNNIRFH